MRIPCSWARVYVHYTMTCVNRRWEDYVDISDAAFAFIKYVFLCCRLLPRRSRPPLTRHSCVWRSCCSSLRQPSVLLTLPVQRCITSHLLCCHYSVSIMLNCKVICRHVLIVRNKNYRVKIILCFGITPWKQFKRAFIFESCLQIRRLL